MSSKCVKKFIWSISLFMNVVLVQSVAAQGSGADTADDDFLMVGLFFAFIILPPILLIHKLILVKLSSKAMHALSKKIDAERVGKVPERRAQTQPKFLEFDLTVKLPAAVEHREKVVKQALKDLKQRWRYGFFASVVYSAILVLMGFFGQVDVTLGVVVVVIYFVLISISYFVQRAEYRPENKSFGYVIQIKLAGIIIKPLFSPRFDIVLWFITGGILLMIAHPTFLVEEGTTQVAMPMGYFIGMCLAVAFHFGLLVKRWFTPYEGPNVTLLILRVFGRSKSAVLTFDRLTRFWRRFGLHLTMDDPDFAKHRYRFFQFRTLALMLGLTILIGANPLIGIGVFMVVIANDWYSLLKRWPVRDQAHARERIKRYRSKPRRANGIFKELHMIAYMNTWKLVVDEYVKVADVVLFDLREYNDDRKGSQYEVNFLFDTFSVNRIVFLRSDKSDKKAIHRMILGHWRELREGSPNMNIEDPVIKIYVSSKQNGQDVQGLMDLLLTAAQN